MIKNIYIKYNNTNYITISITLSINYIHTVLDISNQTRYINIINIRCVYIFFCVIYNLLFTFIIISVDILVCVV